jgi:hypothetical protein
MKLSPCKAGEVQYGIYVETTAMHKCCAKPPYYCTSFRRSRKSESGRPFGSSSTSPASALLMTNAQLVQDSRSKPLAMSISLCGRQNPPSCRCLTRPCRLVLMTRTELPPTARLKPALLSSLCLLPVQHDEHAPTNSRYMLPKHLTSSHCFSCSEPSRSWHNRLSSTYTYI